jgi:hypothetical protein
VSARSSVTSGSNTWEDIGISFNGGAVNNSVTSRVVFGYSSTTGSATNPSWPAGFAAAPIATASTFSNTELYIPNYTSNVAKSFSVDTSSETNAASGINGLGAGLWNPGTQAAITSIGFSITTGTSPLFVAGSTFSLYGIAAVGTTPAIAPKAYGGNIIDYDGTYWIHTFTSSGTFTPQTGLTCDYLVVAGGAGGGNGGSAGGGAGGYRTATAFSVSTTPLAITVGAGGSGGSGGGATDGTAGSNSIFSTITSTGGGQGSASNARAGGNGGSGGGGFNGGSIGTGNTPSTSPSQGSNGGSGSGSAPNYGAGGGGGASAVGANGTSTAGGNGGAGTANSYSGASVTYAGGGGGATYQGGTRGLGGAGGGGNAGTANTNTAGDSGTVNTGGGGGGASTTSGYAASGGAGGSGIVIIRYPAA